MTAERNFLGEKEKFLRAAQWVDFFQGKKTISLFLDKSKKEEDDRILLHSNNLNEMQFLARYDRYFQEIKKTIRIVNTDLNDNPF